MTGVRNSQIDTTRHGSRCLGQIDPLAQYAQPRHVSIFIYIYFDFYVLFIVVYIIFILYFSIVWCRVVGEYEDGVPLVVVLDGEANRAKSREEEEKARREEQEEAAAAEQKQEQGSDRSQAGERSPDDSGGDDMCESGPQPQPQPEKPAKPDQEEQEWGKTVFLNFFPVSKDDPCTGTPHADDM